MPPALRGLQARGAFGSVLVLNRGAFGGFGVLPPPWSPALRGLASPCRVAVFSWPGGACPEPQAWKKTLGEAPFPGQEDKQGTGVSGREKPPWTSPLGHPLPCRGVGDVGLSILVGPSWHPECTPSPGGGLGHSPSLGSHGIPPRSCTHLAALGTATPEVGAPQGPPPLPQPSSWVSQAPEAPGAPRLFIAELQEILWQRVGLPGPTARLRGGSWDSGGVPLSPPIPPLHRALPGAGQRPGGIPILGQRRVAGTRGCLYPGRDAAWGTQIGLGGDPCGIWGCWMGTGMSRERYVPPMGCWQGMACGQPDRQEKLFQQEGVGSTAVNQQAAAGD